MRAIQLQWAPLCALLLTSLSANAAGANSANSSASSPAPSASSSATSSSITVGTNSGVIENYLLAQQQIDRCGQEIAKRIATPSKPAQLFIVEQAQKDQLQALALLKVQAALATQILTGANKDYDEKIVHPTPELFDPKKGAGLVGAGLIAGVSAVQSLLSLFQETVTIGGNQLTTTDEMIIASTMGHLKADYSVEVMRPAAFQPGVFNVSTIESSSIFADLKALLELRNKASTFSTDNKNKIDDLNAFLKQLAGVKKLSPKQQSDQDGANAALKARTDIQIEMDGAVAAADGILQPLGAVPKSTTPDNGTTKDKSSKAANGASAPAPSNAVSAPTLTLTATIAATTGTSTSTTSKSTTDGSTAAAKTPSFADIIAADLLLNLMKPAANNDILTLHTEQVGGGYETQSDLWTFFGSKPISYSGGAIVTFAAYNVASGNVLASGVCGGYSGNVSAKDIGGHGIQPSGK